MYTVMCRHAYEVDLKRWPRGNVRGGLVFCKREQNCSQETVNEAVQSTHEGMTTVRSTICLLSLACWLVALPSQTLQFDEKEGQWQRRAQDVGASSPTKGASTQDQ